MSIDLSKIKKVFFIGIGGIGISYLAKFAQTKGMQVSGVNDERTGKTLDSLKELGIEVLFKDEVSTVPEADLYVYSDAWPHRGPEIIQSAKDTGKPVLSFFEALGEFAKDYKVIAIAGTHGKTTTTAMVAEVLIDAGIDPTVVVGSFVKKFNSNFRLGKSDILVVEADEFNRHFLNFDPIVTIITNIEADHFETYKDLKEIEDAFKELVFKTKNTLICNLNNTNMEVVLDGYKGEVVNYLNYLDELPKLKVPGEHNRMDASCALALAEVFGIDKDKAKISLANFSGTWRRLEKRGVTERGVVVYDDYAHHPTEVRASLQGLRELYPDNKITVLFQPHLYSRTKALFDDFVTAFKDADQVLFLPIYFAREAPDPTISSQILAKAIQNKGQSALAFENFEEAETFVSGLYLGGGDVFVTMGAGEAYKVADKVFKLT